MNITERMAELKEVGISYTRQEARVGRMTDEEFEVYKLELIQLRKDVINELVDDHDSASL